MSQSKNTIFQVLFLLLLNSVLFFLFLIYEANVFIISSFLLGLVCNILILQKIKKVPTIFLFYILIIMMDFYLSLHIFLGFSLTEQRFTHYYNPSNLLKFIVIVNAFKISFFAFLKFPVNYTPIKDKIVKVDNPLFFYTLYIVSFFSTIFGFKGTNIFKAEKSYYAYIENLHTNTGLSEYLILLYLFTWLFATKKFQKCVLIMLFVIMCTKLFLYGFRVQLMMYLCLLYILYFDKTFKISTIFFLSIFAYIFFVFYEHLKEIGSFEILINEISLFLLLSAHEEFILTHFTGNITSSLVVLSELDFKDSLISLIGFVLNIVIPPRILIDFIPQALVPYFVANFKAPLPGGSYFPITFYIWFNILGPFILGGFLAILFNISISNTKMSIKWNFVYLWVILIFTTLPRWTFYTQTDYLFRYPFYFFVAYLYTIIIKKAFLSKKSLS